MGKSYGTSLEQPPVVDVYADGRGIAGDYIDLQGDYPPPFEHQIISDIRERKVALKIVAKKLKITSGDPEYTILREAISQSGVVPKDLEGDATYDINEARKWYGLSEYVPPTEFVDLEESEIEEVSSHEITWTQSGDIKNGILKLSDKEIKYELSRSIIPTFATLLGIPEGKEGNHARFHLRRIVQQEGIIPAELQNNELTPENINIWREKIGLETLSSEQTEQTEVIDPEIEARIQAYPYLEQTKSATTDDYIRARNDLSDWLLIADNLERDNLVRGIQATGIMPKLTDLPNYELIKAQQKNGDISGEYLNFINATRELYGLPAYGTGGGVPPEIAGKQEIIVEDSIPPREDGKPINKEVIYRNRDKGVAKILNQYFPEDEPDSQREETTLGVPPEQETGQDEIPSVLEGDPVDPKLAQILAETIAIVEQEARKDNGGAIVKVGQSPKPDLELMYEQLDNYISQEEGGKLARIEGREYPGEEAESLKQSREAIAVFQQFAQEHPYHTRDKAIQERYRQLEAEAWEALNKLAHSLGGDIITLPQQRDIELAHPEAKDTKEYLESLGYGFDENGDIITIQHHNKTIVLNRPYDISNLIDSPRPAHILIDSLDSDTDLHHTGYVLPGLNPHNPDFIVSTLSKDEFIQGVIVDDPWETSIKYPISNLDKPKLYPIDTTPRLASTIENPSEITDTENRIDISEYEDLGLTKTQLFWVNLGIENGHTREQIALYARPDFNDGQTYSVWQGVAAGLTIEQVASYAKPEYTLEQMSARRALLNQEVQEPSFEVPTNLISGESFKDSDSERKYDITALRQQYARAEEYYNRNRGDEVAKSELTRLREEYNQTIERVFGIMVAEGLEQDIHKIFVQEVYNLREDRITQSKELQSDWERRLNPMKEKFLNFAIKNKKFWAFTNISLTTMGILLASTGAGIPVAGALKVFQRAVGSVMTGAAAREGMRALLEDADVKLGPKKWQSVIPKLVAESLQDGYVDTATDTDLSTKLSTLEAYYRLNGGKFTNDSQQKAYEIILMKLGQRVQEKTIESNQSRENNDSKLIQGEENKETSPATGPEIENAVSTPEQNNARYTSELLKTMSEKRISELQKQQNKRLIANIVGTAVGGGLMTSLAVDMMRPGGVLSPEQVSTTSKPEVEPISPTPPSADGSMAETAKEMAQNLSPEQLQDISQLSEGETLWGEVAKKLGDNPTDAQIQQGVGAYMGTSEGQETMFSLARETEGGSALLSEWGIDNAGELSQVSKTDLYELSRHLGVGQLKGLDSLDISNLPPLDEVSTSTGFNPAESTSSGVTPPGPGAESLPQVDENVFMSEAAKTLGIDNANLTETEFTNIMYSYLETEQGRDALYNLALSDESRKILLEQQFGVYSIEDFNRLSPTELYNLSQSVDIAKLEGFNLDTIILSKFENAPDSITLIKGAGPLTQVNQYIDMYVGGLPYESTLGQEVLTTYLQTEEGKNWLYDAIVENKDTLNGNESIQAAKEYFRQEGVRSAEDINWAKLSKDTRYPTSIFWREITLPTGKKIPALSTLLKPGQMPGIKKALQLVLDKQ